MRGGQQLRHRCGSSSSGGGTPTGQAMKGTTRRAWPIKLHSAHARAVAQIPSKGRLDRCSDPDTGDRLSELGGREPKSRSAARRPSGGNTCVRDNYSAFPIRRVFFQNALSGPTSCVSASRSRTADLLVSSVQIAPAYALREYSRCCSTTLSQFPADPAARHAQSGDGRYLNMPTTTRAIRPRASRPTRTMHAK